MRIIKSTKDQTILFDDSEILIFNTQNISRQQQFVIAIFGILIAIAGIIFHVKDETIFFFVSYLVLLTVWGSYFISYLVRKKDPNFIKYNELSKIEVLPEEKISTFKLYFKDQSKPLKFYTKELDVNCVEFLKHKNLISFD